MVIQLGYEIIFNFAAPTPMALLLYVHPDRAYNLNGPEHLKTDPFVPIYDFIDCFGNRTARITAPQGQLRLYNQMTIWDSGQPEPIDIYARQHPPSELPDNVLPFLLPSRYCEVDKMGDIAWNLFGWTAPGYPRVQAICDWCFNNLEFGYRHARNTKTAFETYNERTAVCRDFMHLACTFCRCLNIPARYATGYLGDIGVPIDPNPMDFSAFMEVYLGGQWWPFDPRHNQRRIGRVLMARGRDAVDVALTTSYGPADLVKFTVISKEIG